MVDFAEMKIITRAWLSGAKMYKALEAVNLGLEWHDGTRKDGVTPEFIHQLAQINYVKAFNIDPDSLEIIIAVIALHDIVEDKRYGIDWIDTKFGTRIAVSVEAMTKKICGKNVDKSVASYYYDIGGNLFASVA